LKPILLLIALWLTACAHLQAPQVATSKPVEKIPVQIPLEDFFRNPALSSVHISPDGNNLALLKSWKNRMNVFVRPLNNPKGERQITFQVDRDISSVQWKGNDYVLFTRDFDGDENFHVLAVNVRSGELKDLTAFKGARAQLLNDLEESSPTDILVTINQNNKELFDVYRINVETGDYKMVNDNKYKINNWLVDHEGNVRGGTADDGVNTVFYFEKSPGKPFVPIFKSDFRNNFQPLAFTDDNQHVYALTNLNRDLITLVEIDPLLPAKKFVLSTLFSHPKYDLQSARYSVARKALGSVDFITDRQETHFIDNQDQSDWDYLKNLLGGGGLNLVSQSRNENLWVVNTIADRTRGQYLVFDRSTRQVTQVGEIAPWLNPSSMSEMKTISFNTSDGLAIEGYLTVPRGGTGHPWPTVMLPHGGPWWRNSWGFQPEVQFLASRGYAVLQLNFRGSTGYGRKFWEASFKQWGRKMQDDITQGVQKFIEDGTFDPKRICIYGGSYGGYATLAGVTFTPDLYACGVDYVGVSNLFTFLKTIPPYWKPFLDMLYEMVGDPVKDKALLTASSPVFHVERIKAPLFIAQGANDPRVNKNESDQMVEALRRRGVEVDYMVKRNEGHGFRNEENRFDFYRAMEKFLAKHLNGGPQ
jgi:dipeptidyl aminopeptidase/acylaminoacyl peptidase